MVEIGQLDTKHIIALDDAELTAYRAYVEKMGKTAVSSMILDVPHYSQNGKDADARINDCGPASAAMVLAKYGIKKTVDQIAIKSQKIPNEYVRIVDLIMAIHYYGSGYGVIAEFKHLRAIDIANAIHEQHPVIALVKYTAMPYQAIVYRGYHFIVVYGVQDDGSLLYRDALAPDGTQIAITPDALDKAMSDYPVRDNQHFQSIVVSKNDD